MAAKDKKPAKKGKKLKVGKVPGKKTVEMKGSDFHFTSPVDKSSPVLH